MSVLKNFRTIPDLYDFLTEDYGKDSNRFVMMSKINDKYEGITYPEFKEETETLALGLAALGVKHGDKVAIISENRPEWVYSDMAILGLGGIDVPLYPSLTAESIEFILNNSDSKGVIVSTRLQLNKVLKIKHNLISVQFIILLNEKDMIPDQPSLYTFSDVQGMGKIFRQNHPHYLKESYKKINENDLCTIIYTSGTTGEPKGVMLTHKNILSNVKAANEVMPISNTDIFLSFLPLCHIFERMGGYYTSFSTGGLVCYAESIEKVAQNMMEVQPTILTTVPRLFERIYSKVIKNVESQSDAKKKIFYWALEVGRKHAAARKKGRIPFHLAAQHRLADKLVFGKLKEKMGGKLRFFISGGAALSRELGEFFEAIGVIIIEGYGLTESSPVIAANTLTEYKFGSVGKPFPGVEVKIADDGEILARGPNIMQGYYKNKKETHEVIKDGWLHTGDIGLFDSEGFLVITDRKKHLFKTSTGKYIAPNPIESVFLTSKYIDQFVVIGDRRMYLSALIVPDFEAIKEYADTHKIHYHEISDLIKKKEIYNIIEQDISKLQKGLANYEKIRKFTLLDHQFTLESGEVTPSLKLKRKTIEEKYNDLINEMYT
jgi:long-chain acyl-CoA synthetase